MEIMEVNDLTTIFLKKHPIGVGNTAKCYVTKDGNVIKLYRHNFDAEILLRDKDYISKLSRLSELKCDSYMVPEKLILKHKKLIGYIYKYVNPKDLAQISNNTKVSELLGENLQKLIDDTLIFSEGKFKLYDIHHRNILYNDSYKVIDLDKGSFYEKMSTEELQKKNCQHLLKTILYHIYNIKDYHVPTFYDVDIDDYIYHKDMTDMKVINEILDELKNVCNHDDPTIQMVRNRSKCHKEFTTYFKTGY